MENTFRWNVLTNRKHFFFFFFFLRFAFVLPFEISNTDRHVLKCWTHTRQGWCISSLVSQHYNTSKQQASQTVSSVLLYWFCFYQVINTRGRHSMTCSLWMGWQVIDGMRMEKRVKEESEERSWRWVCWMREAGLSSHCRIVRIQYTVMCGMMWEWWQW